MIRVNLLSPEKKDVGGGGETGAFPDEARESKLNIPAIAAAVIITFGSIGYLYFSQTAEIDNKQQTLAERRARKAELDKVLQTLAQLEKTKKNLDKKIEVIEKLKGQQMTTVRMMDELSKAIPESVWLTKLNFSKGTLTLSGKAFTNNLIADFMNNLDSSGYFTEIHLRASKRERKANIEVFDFSIVCQFNEPITKKAV